MSQRHSFSSVSMSLLITLALGLPSMAQPQLTEQSKVFIDGIGPIRAGMTIAEAEASAQVQLVERGVRVGLGSCYYLWPKTGPDNLGFMISSSSEGTKIDRKRDRIARVDVMAGSKITTPSGAKIGDTEARIKALYLGHIQVAPHQYTARAGGHYLIFTPKDRVDQNYRIIFETLNGKVTRFRAGKLPEVAFVEGCA